MEVKNVAKWILLVMALTANGGVATTKVGEFASKEGCERSGQIAKDLMQINPAEAEHNQVPSVKVNYFCVPSE